MKSNTQPESMASKADAAFRKAASKVLERARQSGTGVVIWEDGEVKVLEPNSVVIAPGDAAQRSEDNGG